MMVNSLYKKRTTSTNMVGMMAGREARICTPPSVRGWMWTGKPSAVFVCVCVCVCVAQECRTCVHT